MISLVRSKIQFLRYGLLESFCEGIRNHLKLANQIISNQKQIQMLVEHQVFKRKIVSVKTFSFIHIEHQ